MLKYIIINTFVISGTVYIVPVFGGYVSDSFAGKYNTILGSGLLYILGRKNLNNHITFMQSLSADFGMINKNFLCRNWQ